MAEEYLSKIPKRVEVEKLKVEGNQGKNIDTVSSYLGRFMQVEVSDGRVLEGRFRCFDKQKNIVLSDTTEIKKVLPLENAVLEDVGAEPEEEEKKKVWQEKHKKAVERLEDKKNGIERKKVGLVLLPGKDVVKCCLDENSEAQPWVSRRRKPVLDLETATETSTEVETTEAPTEIKP
eukprot:TRINITY_DN14690_c0_g1_i1.p2 TRINITY_DN14690_c0_g1~~TRINITY_DN14690_c0_g1_i1.p2  ORF type:complete len:177 (-),score=53.86 TRINITY_DN14690_c0_g1_i1:17-547(-)